MKSHSTKSHPTNTPSAPSPTKYTLRVQSVLYGNEPDRIAQTIAHLDRAVDLAIFNGYLASATLVYGDCSPVPVFTADEFAAMAARHAALGKIEHRPFGANLGSARGHNTLFADNDADLVLIMNPDVMMAPNALIELIKAIRMPKVGMVEAKQLPIEHPKEFDAATGETPWATTACALLDATLMKSLDGFDADAFFLYCDDLDYSWRVRLAGYKIIYQSTAAVFHDKRLDRDGKWMAGAAEHYFSAEAALMLAHKYSRPDVVAEILGYFEGSGVPHLEKAASAYASRKAEGTLPTPIDPDRKIAFFENGIYAKHRYSLL